MYTDTFIKNFAGKILAIQRTEDNGDILLLEFPSRRPIAQYLIAQNMTVELPSRKILSKGNILLTVLNLDN